MDGNYTSFNETYSDLNASYSNLNATDEGDDLNLEMRVFWVLGIGISTLCLVAQIFLFVVVPASRKLDQKILTQMTVARLLNVIFEYLIFNSIRRRSLRDVAFTLYFQTDVALICWMFVFTKNLYNKVVVVFHTRTSLLLVSVLIWVLTLPIGLLCPLLINLGYFDEFYRVYGVSKFVVLSVNVLFFCRIFWIAFARRASRNLKRFIRTCVAAFLLVCITSLQVFLSDLISYFADDVELDPRMGFIFCIINSYEAVAMTILFIILVEGASDESIMDNIKKRFIKNVDI